MTTNLFSDTPSAGSMARQEDDEPNQRPLQLPKIGWGDDDEPDGNDNITPQQHPAFGQDESDGGVVLRALSRNSEGDLMPIPEDVSIHGAWPDYYPDLLGCYDYDDERKKYRYRRCGPNFQQRMGVIILIIFVVFIGSKGYHHRSTRNNKHNQPQHIDNGGNSDGRLDNLKDTAASTNEYPDVKIPQPDSDYFNDHPDGKSPPSEDEEVERIYKVIRETLDPMMFDDDTEWDGTYFDAFRFCGTQYSRIPCPYLAYCPLGPGHAPIGGTKANDKSGGSWAPVLSGHGTNDKVPDWIQLGDEGTCKLYSKIYDGKSPPWADDPGSVEIKRHVMCCKESTNSGNGTTHDEGEDGGGGGEEQNMFPDDPDVVNRPPILEEDDVENDRDGSEINGDEDNGGVVITLPKIPEEERGGGLR